MSGPAETPPVDPGSARRRGILLILVVFVLGLVCGAALSIITVRSVLPRRPPVFRQAQGPGPDGPGGGFERMAEQLDLSEDQRRRVREIMHDSRAEVRQVLDRSRDEIRALLDDEQRETFDRLQGQFGGPEMRGRHPGHRGPGGGPGGGPPPPPPGR